MTAQTMRRKKNLTKLANFFAENGNMSLDEYLVHPERPMTMAALNSVFRSYQRFLMIFERFEPELWDLATGDVVKPDTSKIEAALLAAENALVTGEGSSEKEEDNWGT